MIYFSFGVLYLYLKDDSSFFLNISFIFNRMRFVSDQERKKYPKFFGFGKIKILACGITFSALEYPSYADKSKLLLESGYAHSSSDFPYCIMHGYMGFGFSFSLYIFFPFTQR